MLDKYNELISQANKLNIPINSGVFKPRDSSWVELNITEFELYRRIKEEKRHRRENWLFWIAIMSMIVSIISAAIALNVSIQSNRDTWTGFFYPDMSNLIENEEFGEYSNLESCKNAAINKIGSNANAGYECGLKP